MNGENFMFSIRLENFRCFKDTETISIKPLTLLLGGNSTGKSSLLRFFPLIKQSFSRKITGPILWAGDDDYVDFGSFEETLYKDANEESIDITFKTKILHDRTLNFKRRYIIYFDNNFTQPRKRYDDISYKISIKSKEIDYINMMKITIFNSKISMSINEDGKVYKLIIDEYDATKVLNKMGLLTGNQNSITPILHFLPNKIESEDKTYYYVSNRFNPIVKWFNSRSTDKRLNQENYENLAFDAINLFQAGNKKIIERLLKKHTKKSLQKLLKTITPEKENELRAIIFLSLVTEITETLYETLRKEFENSYYIAPIRAEANRYYRIKNISAQEIDYQGKNIAVLLNSLTSEENDSLKNWMDKNFDFYPIIEGSGKGHLAIKIHDRNTGDFNLTDTGFGYSQILPIAVQLWLILNRKTNPNINNEYDTSKSTYLLIEQPELHLHPALQAKFIDVIISSLSAIREKLNLYVIMETHSEAIVNRVGKHVTQMNIKKEDINVALFSKDRNDSASSISYAEYDEDGYLRNWPLGFMLPEELD